MKVLVLGGSNSVSRGGYVARLVKVMGQYAAVEVDNISVGAMTTLSAVARLFELGSRGRGYDLVVYEFALNDNIVFRGLADGEALARTAIATLLKALAAVAPQARLLPVILAKRADFNPAKPSPIYSAQTALWGDLGVPVCDLRKGLAHIFAGARPEWLYRDELHLAIGAATDIAGSIVARAALGALQGSARTAAEIHSLIEADERFQFGLRYVGPDELADHAHGEAEIVTRSSSLMTTRALRLRSGRVRIAGSPLSLSVLSDRRHNWVRLREGDEPPFRVSTRLNAVDDPNTNPAHLDRFFYAGIPVPVVLRRPVGAAPATVLGLDFPGPNDRGEVLHSASNFAYAPRPLADRYLDLAGVVFADRPADR